MPYATTRVRLVWRAIQAALWLAVAVSAILAAGAFIELARTCFAK